MSILNRIKWLLGFSNPNGDNGSSSVSITCEDALKVVYEFIDGELDNITHEQVMKHFEMCAVCYPHLQLERSFLTTLQNAAMGEKAPAELKSKVLALLENTQ